MVIGKIVDTVILYQLIKKLSTPFSQWEAFKAGVIDEKGNVVISPNKRTSIQSRSLSKVDTFILNLKKILDPVIGQNRLANFAAALFLLKEEDLSEENLEERFKKFIETLDISELPQVKEDAPVNNMGGGHVATYEKPLVKARPVDHFSGHPVFDVDGDTVWRSRFGKKPHDRYSKFIGDSDHGKSIRNFARSNSKAIIVRDPKTGAMTFLRHQKGKR